MQFKNFTPENEAAMIATYQKAANDAERKEAVKAIAKQLGKTTNSIIAKLSSLKVYVVAAKTTKNGSAVIRKAAIVADIAKQLRVSPDIFASIEKATKSDLQDLYTAIAVALVPDSA